VQWIEGVLFFFLDLHILKNVQDARIIKRIQKAQVQIPDETQRIVKKPVGALCKICGNLVSLRPTFIFKCMPKPFFYLLLLLLQVCGPLAAQKISFREKYQPLVDSLSTAFKIPSSVILGVAIIESGSGTSRNSKLLKNFFGIKGRNTLLKTKGIRSSYKQYTTDTASFVDFCNLVAKKRFYPTLAGNPDYRIWIDALSKTGYSEVPATWRSLILNAIKKNGLDKAPQKENSELPAESGNRNI
jgi:Bax protein